MTQPPPQPPRTWLAPEVVQSSAMDCGPASLKCLLDGLGIPVHYGRLREACQTDIDGTSIDTIEQLAVQLGLDAEQVVLPLDHLLLSEVHCFPAVVVSRLPNGNTHFVVAWRRHGPWVQIMDPGVGRRWMRSAEFLQHLYVHPTPVAAREWRAWAETADFVAPLTARLRALGCTPSVIEEWLRSARLDPSWKSFAALDAATRMTRALVAAKALRKGVEAQASLAHCFELARNDAPTEDSAVPTAYWAVHQVRGNAGEPTEQVTFRGAVLVRVKGRLLPEARRPSEQAGLSPELRAALEERTPGPGRKLWQALRADGRYAPMALAAALALGAGAVLLEALLFRGMVDVGQRLRIGEQRLGAAAALVVFLLALALLETSVVDGLLRLGRGLEVRIRAAFLAKLPLLGDRYFHSRLTSDMAERAHVSHSLRQIPDMVGNMARTAFQATFTALAIAWLDPGSALFAGLGLATAVGLTLLTWPVLAERDMRSRTHGGALSRFYLDSLLGMTPIRTHAAERVIRQDHEELLTEWGRAGLSLLRASLAVDGVRQVVGMAIVAWMLGDHLTRVGASGQVLLLVYWATNLSDLGHSLSTQLRSYLTMRNVGARLFEPLGAPEEELPTAATDASLSAKTTLASGAAIRFEKVSVRLSGHVILRGIDTAIEAGSHVAIVGPSGAGKSSLVGLLLGWHRPAEGQVVVNGRLLLGTALAQLRTETAWLDPSVQIWRQSLLENLEYGGPPLHASTALPEILQTASLGGVLERLPDGLQTSLGEGGSLVSGGEGQRVRLGRALRRKDARLVILDEPFRGLDRTARSELMARARAWWKDATLLCITHDVSETSSFSRVLVVEGGSIVEDGSPQALRAQPGSHYGALLAAEEGVRARLWSDPGWRKLHLSRGRLTNMPPEATLHISQASSGGMSDG